MVPEADVPSEFDMGVDGSGLPQRELHDFVVTRNGEHVSICELDEKPSTAGERRVPMHAVGTLRSTEDRSVTMETESADLTEWCIEYSSDPSMPALWVKTGGVWYALKSPAKAYAKTHALAKRRFEICARAYILITTMQDHMKTYRAIKGFLEAPFMQMDGYSEKQILEEKQFILDQLRDLKEEVVSESVFLKELSKKKVAAGASGGKPPASSKSSKKKKISSSSGAASPSSSKPSVPWVPRLDELDLVAQDRLVSKLEKAVRAAMKMKHAAPFLRPVQPEIDGCADYHDRIEHPMDYSTIWEKIESTSYKHVSELLKDVRLIRLNCEAYNGGNHVFTKYAAEVESKFEREARICEDAELKAMQKRLNPATSSTADKKKSAAAVATAAADGEGGDGLAPSGRKPPASGKSKSKSKSKSKKAGSSEASGGCISTADGSRCGKRERTASRYCSDACGMAVARKKLKALLDEGVDIESYIPTSVGKALVFSNSLNV